MNLLICSHVALGPKSVVSFVLEKSLNVPQFTVSLSQLPLLQAPGRFFSPTSPPRGLEQLHFQAFGNPTCNNFTFRGTLLAV